MPDGLVLHPVGTLDADSTSPLRQQLATAFSSGVRHVVLELDDVAAIDVDGLGVLAGAARYLQARDGSLRLRGATPDVATALRVNGLGTVLERRRALRSVS